MSIEETPQSDDSFVVIEPEETEIMMGKKKSKEQLEVEREEAKEREINFDA